MLSFGRKDPSRSACSKRSAQKGTSSSERIIPESTVIGYSPQLDIEGGGRETDMEMGQIRVKTMIESVTGASEPRAGGASERAALF